jgi:hypothetical protein
MEVDLVVASKLRPTNPEIIFGIGVFLSVADGFDKAEGITPISASTPIEVTIFLVK